MKFIEVACGIIVYGKRVLAARRNAHGALPLHWEFPGGKLEENESAEKALRREIREELHMDVRIVTPLPCVEYTATESSGIRLHPFICSITGDEPAPVPLEHCEIRWIFPEDAYQLTWAPADIPLVRQLKTLIVKENGSAHISENLESTLADSRSPI